MPDANFNKLERVQYALAHVVTDVPAYSRDHMKSVLVKLHWLPIRARESFEIDMMVFRIRQTNQPSSLTELLRGRRPIRDTAVSCVVKAY